MVGGLDDPPGVVVVADVPAPGERLVSDPHAVVRGALGQASQLGRGEGVIVDRRFGDVRAHQHRLDAEPLHDGELSLGAAQVLAQHRLGHGLEVSERLIEADAEPELVREIANVLRRQRRRDQVWLEKLHLVEAGGCRGVELVLQRSAEADRRDRSAHPGERWLDRHAAIGVDSADSSPTWASMRSRSGRTPTNSSIASAACSATMAAPDSVRQPRERASASSWVSIGT